MSINLLLTTTVNKSLKGLFENLLKEFGNEVEYFVNNRILEYQVEEYQRNSFTKTLLHRVQPRKLQEIYQPLTLRPSRNHFSVDGFIVRTESVGELFVEKQYITVLGSAGSGKSTLVRYLFLNALDSGFRIPITVELRYLNDFDGSVIEFIRDRIFKLNKFTVSDKIAERLMASGDFIFFLDGYDEVNSSKKGKITKEIDELVKLYSKNFYLITSRPYSGIDMLPLFLNYEVCELTDEDIGQFITKQIPTGEEELLSKIIESVNSMENDSYKSFLKNPLLLSMFILTFQSYATIPPKRSEFYSQVFEALFSVHDSMSKLAFVREKQCGLTREQFIEVLKLFSFVSFFEERFVFGSLYLDEKLRLIKERKRNIMFENVKLIDDLQTAICILNREGTDYVFPHRSLQEYFAALYISSIGVENKKTIYKKILDELISNPRHSLTTRENFYLLLSELDEEFVINYLIIPFLRFYRSAEIDGYDEDQVIDHFFGIHDFYDVFRSILQDNETRLASRKFDDFFENCFPDYKNTNMNGEGYKRRRDMCREKLAWKEISPFLGDFLPRQEKKIAELQKYLREKNQSDSDIISLI